MSITSKVRQSVILAADGQVQSLVGGSATNITKANIMTVFAMSSAADGEVKLYNEIGSGVTASKLIFHGSLVQQRITCMSLKYQELVFMLTLEYMQI